jgi:hypothetical protein
VRPRSKIDRRRRTRLLRRLRRRRLWGGCFNFPLRQLKLRVRVKIKVRVRVRVKCRVKDFLRGWLGFRWI